MRIAWFRPAPASATDSAALLDELRRAHELTIYDERGAHDCPWQHARHPFDQFVYELGSTPASAFVWPYLLQFPGIVWLRARQPQRSRAGMLRDTWRAADYAAEAAFAGRRPLTLPLLAARLAVVGDRHAARVLQQEYPEARIRWAPVTVADPLVPPHGRRPDGSNVVVCGLAGADSPVKTGPATERRMAEAMVRAVARARQAGADVDVRMSTDLAEAEHADIVVAFEWPPAFEPPAAAIPALAAGRAVIVHETGVTAGWPALDPQTWQPRGVLAGGDPIAVSIDPRDEEHSLMLALRRLAADRTLRAQLGAAARKWWHNHASPSRAAAVWSQLLQEAGGLEPPRHVQWPPHLTADGSESTRAILSELGVTVDFLPSRG